MALKHLARHRRAQLGSEGRIVDLADPGDAAGGSQPQENEVTAPVTRRWVAEHKGLNALKLHTVPVLSACSLTCQPRASSRIMSAARMASINVGALVLPDVMFGKVDASTTRKPSIS